MKSKKTKIIIDSTIATKHSEEYERSVVSTRKFNEKGGRVAALCDLCEHHKAMHLHEIIERKLTVGSEVARTLSFSKFLTSILCLQCHIDYAHTNGVAEFLLMKNSKRYGPINVKLAYDGVYVHLNAPQKFDVALFSSELQQEEYDEVQLFYHLISWASPVDIEVSTKQLGWDSDKFSVVLLRLRERGMIEWEKEQQFFKEK